VIFFLKTHFFNILKNIYLLIFQCFIGQLNLFQLDLEIEIQADSGIFNHDRTAFLF